MKKKTSKKAPSFGLFPLGDRLILQEVKEKEKNHSGIYIPETAKEDRGTKKGLVVAVGEGRIEDGKITPMKVGVGDKVLYQWGDQIVFDGEEYTVIRESEVIAIIK